MSTEDYEFIDVNQLCVGLFIRLDLSWLDHPFPTNTFKIRDDRQLRTLHRLGLKRISYLPARSDCSPLAKDSPPPPPVAPGEAFSAEEMAAQAAKKQRIERMQQQREAVAACEKKLLAASQVARELPRTLFAKPGETVEAATRLVGQMADTLLGDCEIIIHALNDKVGAEDVYYHSLNVAVLTMLLAREVGRSADDIRAAGMVALFHDIGKLEIPDSIVKNPGPLSSTERHFLQQHSVYGEEIARRSGLPEEFCQAIRQHHEHMDGSGFPDRLKGEQISPLARILAIPNNYDNHCNHINPLTSLTPFEALSQMFAKQRPHFDPAVLKVFIHCMGIYPPGTVVRMSNDSIGLVLSVNPKKPLKPTVMIYDSLIPREEAMILDMESEPDISISKSIPPAQLPAEIRTYLSPRTRMTYYFDEAPGTGNNNAGT